MTQQPGHLVSSNQTPRFFTLRSAVTAVWKPAEAFVPAAGSPPAGVYLRETQARAMMCAACSTRVCLPLFSPPSASLCSKSFGFFFISSHPPPQSVSPPSSFLSFLFLFPLTVTVNPISFCLAQCCCEMCPEGPRPRGRGGPAASGLQGPEHEEV